MSDDFFAEFDIEFEDITEKLTALADALTETGIDNICSETYELKDSLCDIEACDPRTDAKSNIEATYLAPQQIAAFNLKPAEALTPGEVIGIYDEFFKREMGWLSGQSLPHCFYEFVYIHFPETYKESLYIDLLVQHSQCAMKEVYLMLQSTDYRSYDDFSVSILGFFKEPIVHDEIVSKMKTLENTFAGKLKKIKKGNYEAPDWQIEDALCARLSLRKAITMLIFTLRKLITDQKKDNIDQYLNSIEKNAKICRRTLKYAEPVDQYFKTECVKSLLCQFSVKDLALSPMDKVYDEILEMVKHLRMLIAMPDLDNLHEMFEKLFEFSNEDTNVFVRTVQNMNLLAKDRYYFQKTHLCQFLYNGIMELSTMDEEFQTYEVEKNTFIENAVIIIQNMMIKIIRSPYSFHAKLNKKSFLELSYLLHEGAKIDELLEIKHKPFMLFIYQFILFFNLQKLELTFKLDLLSHFELPFVWMYMEDVCNLYANNYRTSLGDLPVKLINDNKDKTFPKMIWEQLEPRTRNHWSRWNIHTVKCMLSKAMFVLTQFLMRIGLIKPIGTRDEVARRFAERFVIFEPCIYCKKFKFEDYEALVEVNMAKAPEADLAEAKAMFGKAKNICDALIAGELYEQKWDGYFKNLRKVIITNSLLVVTLMMKKGDYSTLKFGLKPDYIENLPIYELTSIKK